MTKHNEELTTIIIRSAGEPGRGEPIPTEARIRCAQIIATEASRMMELIEDLKGGKRTAQSAAGYVQRAAKRVSEQATGPIGWDLELAAEQIQRAADQVAEIVEGNSDTAGLFCRIALRTLGKAHAAATEAQA